MKIDQEKCIGCGTCFSTFSTKNPNRIEQNGSGYEVKKGLELNEQEKEELVNICPVGAIGE